MLASNVASGAQEAVFHDTRENIVEALLAILALTLLFFAMTGRLGAFLGAAIAPGGMVEN